MLQSAIHKYVSQTVHTYPLDLLKLAIVDMFDISKSYIYERNTTYNRTPEIWLDHLGFVQSYLLGIF